MTAPDTADRRKLYHRAKDLPMAPGVYRLLAEEKVLYVGKAARLRPRVSSYFSGQAANSRITRLVMLTEDFDVTLTRTEAEALLLEDRLIKEHRPPYNIMLRDDKSYPWIRFGSGETPGIYFHRGARKRDQRYFGPFASAGATRQTINEIRRAFRLRNCSDSVFNSRSRPCLQYQIQRCSAPCTDLISSEDYRADCQSATRFLAGDSLLVLRELGEEMTAAAERLEFEQAGKLRDRIASLSKVRENQAIYAVSKGDCDVLAAAGSDGAVCVAMLQIRDGTLANTSTHFPRMPRRQIDDPASEGLAAFLSSWYLSSPAWIPPLLRVPPSLPGRTVMAEAFSRAAGRTVQIRPAQRGQPLEWLRLASTNAEAALKLRLQDGSRFARRLVALGEILGLPQPPQRLECHDVSHHRGEHGVVSCVVFGPGGPQRSDWRTYRLRDTADGDDYGALKEMLRRRYRKMPADQWPDVLVLDGGKGQLSSALEVLDELQVKLPMVLAIAKGPTRQAGRETLFCGDPPAQLEMEPNTPARLLLQHARDEAHRLAIRSHRQGMRSKRQRSVLEQIPGVGPVMRRALLTHFGGIREIRGADPDALGQVPGIGPDRAQSIYNYLHG